MMPIGDIVELSVMAAKLAAQGIAAIMASKDLSDAERAQHIQRITDLLTADLKDVQDVPLPKPTAR